MGTKISFNPNALDKLQAGSLADPQTPGLYLEVHTGHDRTNRVWKYRRRIAGRKPARSLKATLGAYPLHSIADARDWATKLNVSAERGIDPADAVRAERAAHTKVADAHALYMASVRSGARRKLKPRSIRGKEQIWSCDIERQIGKRIVQELTDDDLWSLVLGKGKTAPIRANRLAAELKVF
ncbi:MAG: hypothetical protein JWR80_5363, partial [Bradyrhizobium sp.]|nr:hypothetical protein [Bradyrhizobium sp.]